MPIDVTFADPHLARLSRALNPVEDDLLGLVEFARRCGGRDVGRLSRHS